ncbi:MAG: DNA-3-methyladenine glycosylase I [Pseudomonadota bacterium]
MERCGWVGTDPIYELYHDTEWGVPEYDSRALWEKLVLDGFQAGLSWITILKKREAFRAAFEGFDPERVARMGPADVDRLLGDPGIVRHRGKIEGAIRGARVFLELDDFSGLVWAYVGGQPLQSHFKALGEVPAKTDLSTKMSKDLKKLGFTFCGPTIVYAWMQACGLVNDHILSCHRHDPISAMARNR